VSGHRPWRELLRDVHRVLASRPDELYGHRVVGDAPRTQANPQPAGPPAPPRGGSGVSQPPRQVRVELDEHFGDVMRTMLERVVREINEQRARDELAEAAWHQDHLLSHGELSQELRDLRAHVNQLQRHVEALVRRTDRWESSRGAETVPEEEVSEPSGGTARAAANEAHAGPAGAADVPLREAHQRDVAPDQPTS